LLAGALTSTLKIEELQVSKARFKISSGETFELISKILAMEIC
jgi:hypothetical protein